MKKKVLILGFVWPEPKSSAAGSRMLQLIEQFQKQDYDITFASAAKTSDNSFDLKAINVETKAILLNDASFDTFISELDPNIVVFDRFMTEEQFGWRVAEQCPDALRILDTEDFHGLRMAREQAVKQNEEYNISHLQNTITKREIASIYRCDLSLIISEAEMDLLINQFKIDDNLLYYLPFLIDPIPESDQKLVPSFKARQHFISIGNFLHAPNFDAVLYLKQTIWPLIRQQLPDAELHMYGAYESQKVTQLNTTKEGFLIKGFVSDVHTVMRSAKVCLAPLRFGAGLKGKLIDAMQNGTPCLMSTIAAEGMFETIANDDVNGFVENHPEDFANKAVQLYTNPEIWKGSQNIGFRVLNQRFNKMHFESEFKARVETLSNQLQSHRASNFIGQILMHQTLQSTKYMSKWIEAKNR